MLFPFFSLFYNFFCRCTSSSRSGGEAAREAFLELDEIQGQNGSQQGSSTFPILPHSARSPNVLGCYLGCF